MKGYIVGVYVLYIGMILLIVMSPLETYIIQVFFKVCLTLKKLPKLFFLKQKRLILLKEGMRSFFTIANQPNYKDHRNQIHNKGLRRP